MTMCIYERIYMTQLRDIAYMVQNSYTYFRKRGHLFSAAFDTRAPYTREIEEKSGTSYPHPNIIYRYDNESSKQAFLSITPCSFAGD